MKNALKFLFTQPWGLFVLSILFFSASLYVFTDLFILWGIATILAAVGRSFTVRDGNVIRRNYDRY